MQDEFKEMMDLFLPVLRRGAEPAAAAATSGARPAPAPSLALPSRTPSLLCF